MGFVKIFWIKNNIQDAYLQKISISGQIVSDTLAQLYSDDSIQILLNLTWVWTIKNQYLPLLLGVSFYLWNLQRDQLTWKAYFININETEQL